jgi:hypothetical protein
MTPFIQPYEEPIVSDDASGADDDDDDAVPGVDIEDPASSDGATTDVDADGDDAEEAIGSPSFGQNVLEGDIW